MTEFRHIEVRPLAGALGAEIGGVDASKPLDDETVAEIRRALLDHLVIFFRGQELDDESHKAFTRRFGEIFVHPNFDVGGENDPEIVRILRKPGDTRHIGFQWHTDATMMAEPPMAGILYALRTPPYGADTLFANQYMAYETLSDGLKDLLGGLKAIHSDVMVAGPHNRMNAHRASKIREDDDWRETAHVHPVVRTHPETGRKSLFVNHSYTTRFEGMTVEESRPLLDYLLEHGHRPEFTCRFAWSDGAIAFWDNRCTKHIAINDVPQYERIMQRTQVVGGPVA